MSSTPTLPQTTHEDPALAELPDLGRELTPQERELIRLLAEWIVEQLSLGEEATAKGLPVSQKNGLNVFVAQGS